MNDLVIVGIVAIGAGAVLWITVATVALIQMLKGEGDG